VPHSQRGFLVPISGEQSSELVVWYYPPAVTSIREIMKVGCAAARSARRDLSEIRKES
jgi:hypothetical protein